MSIHKKQIEKNISLEEELKSIFGADCVFQINWTNGSFNFEIAENRPYEDWYFSVVNTSTSVGELNQFMAELLEGIKNNVKRRVDYKTLLIVLKRMGIETENI